MAAYRSTRTFATRELDANWFESMNGWRMYVTENVTRGADRFGLDLAHPFFDRRLVEFCLALPPEQRLHDGWDRVVQRRAFEGLVPDEIRSRQSKSVWSENFEHQLFTRHGELLRRVIDSDQSPLRGLCDLQRLRRDRVRLAQQPGRPEVLDLWCAVTLGLWLEGRRQ